MDSCFFRALGIWSKHPPTVSSDYFTCTKATLLTNGMGQVLQEARGQSGEILPAGEHAVSGPHQRTAQRAWPEQLFPQQCCAGLLIPHEHFYVKNCTKMAVTASNRSSKLLKFICCLYNFIYCSPPLGTCKPSFIWKLQSLVTVCICQSFPAIYSFWMVSFFFLSGTGWWVSSLYQPTRSEVSIGRSYSEGGWDNRWAGRRWSLLSALFLWGSCSLTHSSLLWPWRVYYCNMSACYEQLKKSQRC